MKSKFTLGFIIISCHCYCSDSIKLSHDSIQTQLVRNKRKQADIKSSHEEIKDNIDSLHYILDNKGIQREDHNQQQTLYIRKPKWS